MRVAVYNQMFGMNGRSLISNLTSHYTIHFQKHAGKIKKRENLRETLKIIEKTNSDVIGICEVIETQEERLRKGLNKLGYKYIFSSKGHRIKAGNLHIKVILASKLKCEHVRIINIPLENKMGGGGGFINCYFPKQKLNIILVHLASSISLRDKQIEILQDHFRNKKIIIMGDFNTCYDNIKHHFTKFNLISGRVKTCSLTNFIRYFFWKDLDHILTKNVNKIDVGTHEGKSDHKLLYADLELV